MMGSFEKLGILVIVVIIVMILAVAIYQWGATEQESGSTVLPSLSGKPEPLVIDLDDPLPDDSDAAGGNETQPAAKRANAWPVGIPKTYVIQNHDIVWKLVVKQWRLKDTFIEAIKKANPTLNMKRLRAGDKLKIPNPQKYLRASRSKKTSKKGKQATREYRIQDGDRLESIAKEHLGRRDRWKEIQALNPGLNPKNMRLGDPIRLPLK